MEGSTRWDAAGRVRASTREVLLLLALFVAWVQPAAAQPGTAEREARLTEIFTAMDVRTGVRVTTPLLFIDHGAFLGLGPEAVRIQFGGEVVPVELADIRSVHVEGHHPVQGMLWGLGAGALVGSVTGLLVASFNCTSPITCIDDEKRGATRWGTVLAVAGGFGGFMIGNYNVSWRPIFP